ncbi:Serine/threonine-protein phosphatase PGAM5, mitochondrial, partial [Geodia barretti]
LQRAKAKAYDLEEAIGQYKKGVHKWNRNWDHRASPAAEETDGEKKKEPQSKAKRHLFLIRHGQYEMWHKDSKLKKLTELGRQQAKETGERLSLLGYDYSILYFSTLPRATETAQIISESLPNVPTESCGLLREGAPFPPDPPSKNWRPDYSDFFQEGSRIEAAFCRYFHRAPPSQEKDSYEILVCHANVIRYFVCRALQLPPQAWIRMTLAHGSITRLTIRPNGSVSLYGLGDCGHSSQDKITYS